MSKKIRLTLFIILLGCLKLSAQEFYVSSLKDANNLALGSNVYKVTITPSGLTSELIAPCTNLPSSEQYASIAMDLNGFYWLSNSFVYRAQLNGNSLINCEKYVGSGASSANNLTVGQNQNLYYVSNDLLATDLNTKLTANLGKMNFQPSGDLCFYNNNLYMAATNGIVKVDMANPANSTMFIPTDANLRLYGLVCVATGTRKNTVYALSSVSNSVTDLLEIDMENKIIATKIGTLPYGVLDAASPVEGGQIIGIVVDKLNILQSCNDNGLGRVEVITIAHIEEQTYVLNGQTNKTGIFDNIPPGTYTMTISSASDQQLVSVVVPPLDLTKPSYNFDIKSEFCGTPGEISFYTAAPNTINQIRYGASVFPLNQVFTGLISGTYHFEILNAKGCKVDELDLIVPKECYAVITNVDIAPECGLNKAVVTVTCPPIPETYTYSLSNGMTNGTGVFNQVDPGTYTLTVTTSGGGKPANQTIVVPDFSLTKQVIAINKTEPACENLGKISFTYSSSADQYMLRYNSTLYPATQVFSNLSPGAYHFELLRKNGCLIENIDATLVYQVCIPIITKVDIVPACDELGKAVVTVTCPPIPETYTYSLSNGITNSTGVFSRLDPGNYTLTVSTSGGGMPASQVVVVPDFSLTTPKILVNKTDQGCDIPSKVFFTLEDQEAHMISFESETYPSTHVFSGLSVGYHSFTILKKNGCIVDIISVKVVKSCGDVSFPTAFTPNNDGVNDVFRITNESTVTKFLIKIYDRRGVMVASSTNLQACWNGDFKGKPVPVGTYYWVAKFIGDQQIIMTKNGVVSLIR